MHKLCQFKNLCPMSYFYENVSGTNRTVLIEMAVISSFST